MNSARHLYLCMDSPGQSVEKSLHLALLFSSVQVKEKDESTRMPVLQCAGYKMSFMNRTCMLLLPITLKVIKEGGQWTETQHLPMIALWQMFVQRDHEPVD